MYAERNSQKLTKLAHAVDNLNLIMIEASYIAALPEFKTMPRHCRGTLSTQIYTGQKLLNDYQIYQNYNDSYIEFHGNYRQYMSKVKRHTRVLTLHVNKIQTCLEQFSTADSDSVYA